MNEALLSSKNMSWCTPLEFFAELDREFHFDLDPAATDKSAKCAKYFTPADTSTNGCAKATRKVRSLAPSWLCSYQPERTRHTSTTTYSEEKPTRCASCVGGSPLQTRMETRPRMPRATLAPLLFLLSLLSGAALTWARTSETMTANEIAVTISDQG